MWQNSYNGLQSEILLFLSLLTAWEQSSASLMRCELRVAETYSPVILNNSLSQFLGSIPRQIHSDFSNYC